MKRVSWASKPFSFRLRIRGENDHETPQNVGIETEVADTLLEWMQERPSGQSATGRLAEIIVWMVLEVQGKNAKPTKSTGIESLARLVNQRFDHLSRKYDEKTAELLRALVQNPRAMGVMNEQHAKHTSGQEMDDDFLDSLLQDFDR